MEKKGIFILILAIFLVSFVIAQEAKFEVTSIKESYTPNDNVSIRISLLDSENKPINSEVSVLLEDAEKRSSKETTIPSNKISEISLPENAPSGFWNIIATYGEQQSKTSFLVESNEEVSFSIDGDLLTITNTGNTRYEKDVQIIIGDTVGLKRPSLEIGETISFRLIAPEGTYNIKVTDGTSSIVRGNVQLTGEVIGILDDRINKRTPITGGGPENLETSSYSFIKQNPFIYVFVLAVVGATILLAIERHYRRKADEY
jgi:hypothetical protein